MEFSEIDLKLTLRRIKIERVGLVFQNLKSETNFEAYISKTYSDKLRDDEFAVDINYLKSLDPKEWKDQDHYAVLGLGKLRFQASDDDIRRAYRKMVLQHHPDKRKAKGEQVKTDDDYFTCITKAYEILAMESSEDEDEVLEAFDGLNEDLVAVLACRRGINLSNVPKSIEWRENILTNMDNERFLQMLRVDRSQFAYLLSIICDDIEFNKLHSSKQFSVELQLAVVLYRLGSYGGSAAVRKISTLFGIGDGGTLTIITKRLFRVILKLLPTFLYWPSSEERSEIVTYTYSELPLCIGYVDGTEIKLAEAPVTNHESFFSRCHIYSIKAQVVCDYKLQIRHVVVGNPGSCHDAKIFKNCSLFKNKEQFFSGHEWIAGDSAYQLSDTVITPYRSNSKQLTDTKRKAFNLRHSKFRVRVEHCFGLLKGKFGSLKELRMRIEDKESHRHSCEWVLVCCVIHNILLKHKDSNEIPEHIFQQPAEENNSCTDDVPTNNKYELKRQGIFNLMFNV